MKRKIMILAIALLFFVGISSVFSHAEAVVVTHVTEINEEKIIENQAVKHVDEIVGKLLDALNENDYEKFSSYYNPNMNGSISGSSKKKLSREEFTELHDEMVKKGGGFISKKMVSSGGKGRITRNDYIGTFKCMDYVSRIGIIATNGTGDQCVVDFWILWFDAKEVNVTNNITEDILSAIEQDKYNVFSEKLSDALKLRYSKEEFKMLENNILSELGSYRGKENVFFNKTGNVLSVSSDLYYEKVNKPICLTVDVEFLNGDTRVKKISFKWIPLSVRQQADILAEQSLAALVNENNYKNFVTCFDSKMQSALTKDQFQSLRNVILRKYGKYINKEFSGVNLVEVYENNGTVQLPMETMVFKYTVTFQNTKETNLTMGLVRDNGQLVLNSFYINEPLEMRYIGNIADKN